MDGIPESDAAADHARCGGRGVAGVYAQLGRFPHRVFYGRGRLNHVADESLFDDQIRGQPGNQCHINTYAFFYDDACDAGIEVARDFHNGGNGGEAGEFVVLEYIGN